MFLSYSSHKHTPTSQLRRAFAKVKFRTASDNWAQKSLRGMGDGYVCLVLGGEMEPLLSEVFPWDHSLPLFFVVPYLFGFAAARPASTAHVGFTNFHKLSDPSTEKRNGAPCNQKINVVKKKISIFRSSQILPLELTMEGAFMKWKMGFTTNWAIRTM